MKRSTANSQAAETFETLLECAAAQAADYVGPAKAPRPRIRARAVALGLVLTPVLCAWSLYTEIICGGSELIEASLMPIVIFALFLLALLNNLVWRWRPAAALTQPELILVYTMQTASVGVAGLGQMQFLNQALAGAYSHAVAPEGTVPFHVFIPRWWTPAPGVLRAYYQGNSSFFRAENLRGWALPILSWSGFLLLMLFCFLCLNVLLRRQWADRERLSFPLVVLPLELTRSGGANSLLRRRDFWYAFMAVVLFRSISAVHHAVPAVPDLMAFGPKGQLIDLAPSFSLPPWNAVGYFQLSFHPMIIGLTFLLPLDVSFSAWFFYFVVKGENVLASAMGFRDAGAGSGAMLPRTPEQGAGAFLALALLSLWGARHHLHQVYRKAMGRAPELDDDREALSYRTAFWGFLASFGGLLAFVIAGGMAWAMAFTFFVLYLLTAVALVRLRAEAGPMLAYGPELNPHDATALLPGTQMWSPRDLTTLSYLHWFSADTRTMAMPQQMEALKLADAGGLTPRLQARWMMAASAVAIIAAFVSVLTIYYHFGALTPRGDNSWRAYNGILPFQQLKDWIANPKSAESGRFEWIGIGFLATAALMRARMLFVWWPFHPAGFLMANAGMTMGWVWFPTLLGWMAKAMVLRYGGMRMYQRSIPIFLGLILGDVVVACVWSLIGVLLNTPMYMFFPG